MASWRKWAWAIVWIAVLYGMVAVVLTVLYGRDVDLPIGVLIPSLGFLVLLLIGGTFFLPLLAHECGHALAARLVGMDVYRVVVCNKALYQRTPCLRADTPFRHYVIANKRGLSPTRHAVFLLGGTLANMALAILLKVLANSMWSDSRLEVPLLADTAELASVTSASLGLVQILAVYTYSDFGLLLDLVRSPQSYVRAYESMFLLSRVSDYRPRDYPPEVLEEIEAESSCPYLPLLLQYWKAMDAGDIGTACERIREAYRLVEQEGAKVMLAGIVDYEMSMVAARFLEDRQLSDQAFAKARWIGTARNQRTAAVIAREYVWGDAKKATLSAARIVKRIRARTPKSDPKRPHLIEWYERIVPELAAQP